MNKAEKWSEEDIRLLAHYYSEKLPSYYIAEKLGRSQQAIKLQALKHGYTDGGRSRPWEPEEIALVEDLSRSLEDLNGSITISQVMQRLHGLWARKGWSGRSRSAVVKRINQIKYSRCVQENCYSLCQIADALRCSHKFVQSWVRDKEMLRTLKPKFDSQAIYVPRNNLREFMRRYPGEIAKCAPDIVWLLSVIFD